VNAAADRCVLCGLEWDGQPVTVSVDGVELAFCCPGCANVHAILSERGDLAGGVDPCDTDLFKRSLSLGLISSRRSTDDSPQLSTVNGLLSTEESVFQLSGLRCASCAWLIARALERERSVVSVDVSFASDLMRIRHSPQLLPPSRIVDCVSSLGYTATPFTARDGDDVDERDDLLLRFGVAAFLWLNAMTLSAALYVGYFEQIPDAFRRAIPVLLMALSAPAVIYSAWPILRVAALGLRDRLVRTETFLALGIIVAYGYSVAETARGGPHVYFDTACAIVTLALARKWIERAARARTRASLALLFRSLPKKARLLHGGRERVIAIDRLQPGDWVLVKAGERIPADGEVLAGDSETDESLVTGESRRVAKGEGDPVVAGTLNLTGPLTVRTVRRAADSALAQMVTAVDRALTSRAAIERVADRIARVFVPTVVIVALATCATLWFTGSATRTDAVMRAVAVLVIACPCALGIATPLAITAAVGAASRHGVLITKAEVLESVSSLDLLVLDKTGTATTGEFVLTNTPPDRTLRMLAAVEAGSEHLIGRAIVEAARRRGIVLPIASFVDIEPGLGIRGYVDGRLVVIGSREFVEGASREAEQTAVSAERVGHTAVFYRIGRDTGDVLVFGDTPRREAPALVRRAHADGMRVLLLSGDSDVTTRAIAARIGADEYIAGARPADKVAVVEERQARGRHVVMVGDGVNDGPALAQANLGIALSSGADLAMHASTMIVTRGDLERVSDALALARRTLRVIRQNLFWAFFYNTGGICLAVAGLLHPVAAAVGLILSSVTVIANSMRVASTRL
jgi:heavy metal translocating P-type ATPase